MTDQRTEHASLFIGGLKPSVKRTDIVAHFTKYGEVKNVNMGKLPAGMNNRGFAFVKFSSTKTVNSVLSEKQLIMGREVECRLSYGKKYNQVDMEINSKRKLYVSELSVDDTNEDLQNYFSRFGKIDQAYIIYYPNTNISKCFGYVEFKKEASAAKALNATCKTWKVTNFKSYKELKDSKNELSDSGVKKDNNNGSCSTDSESQGSSNNLNNQIVSKNKGAIYSQIVKDQQNNHTISSFKADTQQISNSTQEQYNYYPNNYETQYYQDQQQIDYYNQDYSQYYGYQQYSDPSYNGYEQYSNQYFNTQDLHYDYNAQNNYYDCNYYQQNYQMDNCGYQQQSYYNDVSMNYN